MAVSLSGCQGSNRRAANWLYLRPVYCVIPAYTPSAQAAGGSTIPPPAAVSVAACDTPNAKWLPSSPPGGDVATATVILPYFYGPLRYVLAPAGLSSSSITQATAIEGQRSGYEVQIDLTTAGVEAFNRIVGEGHLVALDVNGVVVWTSKSEAYNGMVLVSGPATAPFTKNQADALTQRVEQMVTTK
jgi:hypothetical protein